MLHVVVATVTA